MPSSGWPSNSCFVALVRVDPVRALHSSCPTWARPSMPFVSTANALTHFGLSTHHWRLSNPARFTPLVAFYASFSLPSFLVDLPSDHPCRLSLPPFLAPFLPLSTFGHLRLAILLRPCLFYPRIRLASIMAELNAGRHFCLAMAAALVIPGQWMLSAIGLGSPGLVCTAFGFLWPMRPRGVCQQCRVGAYLTHRLQPW